MDTATTEVTKGALRHPDQSEVQRLIPSARREHKVLLGFYSQAEARQFLEGKALQPAQLEELMRRWQLARTLLETLPPLQDEHAEVLPLNDAEARSEVERAMQRPDCKQAFRDDWSAKLVEIRRIVPFQPSMDIEYAKGLVGPDVTPANLISAVRLCFSDKRPTALAVQVDELQKAITISGINPALQLMGYQCGQQGPNNPFSVNLWIGGGLNLVQVSCYRGRCFLTNGYHRVYALLGAGFTHIPCVFKETNTLGETGALGAGFFPEPVLMSTRPPQFLDFADEVLGITVPMLPVKKVIRIRPDEYLVVG